MSAAVTSPVEFAACDEGGSLFLTAEEAVWELRRPGRRPSTLRMRWGDAVEGAQIVPGDRLPGHVNYFRGRDPKGWRSDVPLYGRVVYRAVYPGVDLVFHQRGDRVEYDFVVSPGADPGAVRLAFEGAEKASVDGGGSLVLAVPGGELTHRRPVAYQEVRGERRIVPASFVLANSPADGPGPTRVSFAVGAYDRSQPLVIDPTVAYASTIPIQNTLDALADVAVDAQGNLWLAGITRTDSLPTTDDAVDDTFAQQEGFVVKLDPQGQLVYATYLGGDSAFDVIGNVDVDGAGNVYVAGTTISEDFPVTGDAVQPTIANPGLPLFDAFLVKLDTDGRLAYSTYYGGTSSDHFSGGSEGEPAAAVAVAGDGSVYLAGTTISRDFPVVNALQPTPGGAFGADGFLVKFDADFDVAYSTYFGGGNNDYVYRAVVDDDGNPYLFGCSFRTFGDRWTFPVTEGAFQVDSPADNVNFVAKFDTVGGPAYATLFGQTSGGGGQCDTEGDLAVDAAGNAYIVGATLSDAIPTTAGAFQTTRRGNSDLFVAKLNPNGTDLAYSTYFGGSGSEQKASNGQGVRIAVDTEGNAVVAATTTSNDLPLEDPFVAGPNGGFVTKLNAAGSGLVYSSYLALAAGPVTVGDGAVYLGGNSLSGAGVQAIKVDEGSAPAVCTGDCDGSGTVSVDELVTGVNIALGTKPIGDCTAFDGNGSGTVTVDELVTAVQSALGGCPS